MISHGINIHHKNPTLTAKVGRIMKEVTGAWYDPLLPYLYTTSTGVTSVAAASDPIGLMIDRSKGASLGAELVDTINTVAAWTASGTNTVEQDGDAVKITYVDNAAGAVALFSAASGLSSNLTVNSFYRITYEIKVNSGSVNAAVVNATTNQNTAVTSTTYITQQFTFQASNVATNNFTFANLSAGEIVWVKNISVKLLNGNHAIQSTAAARPTYRVDVNGRPYVAFLGTDDNMTSATGGGGNAGFFYCAAIRPTGNNNLARRLFSDVVANTGYEAFIGSANLFALRAGNGTAFTQATGAAATIGSAYVATFRDDGINLMVRVNGGAWSTIARPSVVAGTQSYTIGRDNVASTNYMVADLYEHIYVKNSGLSLYEVSTIEKMLAAKIGITL